MSSEPDAGGGVGASWYRVAAIPDAGYGGSAERDYASVLPAVLDAAQHRRSFVTGWLSRGAGAPLELVTNAGPLPAAPDRPLSAAPAGGERAEVPGRPAAGFGPGPGQGPGQGDGAGQRDGQHPYDPPGDFLTRLAGRPGRPGPCELLFPWGARGVPCADSVVADLNRMVWAPCHGRQAPLLPGEPGGVRRQSWAPGAAGGAGRGAVAGGGSSWLAGGFGLAAATPTLFEVALTTLMGRPFGWLVVAEPTDLIDAEIAELRSQLNVLRRFDEERSRFDADRAANRLAELDAFREAGLWNVRVLVGAADAEQLSLIAPMLVGSADLSAHPYRLRRPERGPGGRLGRSVRRDGRRPGRAHRPAAPRGARAAAARRRVLRRDGRAAGAGRRRGRHDPRWPGPAGGRAQRADGHPEQARPDHGSDRVGQVPDGQAHARAAHPPGYPLACR